MNDSDKSLPGSNIFHSPDTMRKNRIPPGQKLTDKWPVLHYESIPSIDINSWKFRIFGLVENEVTLSYQQFAALPQNKVVSDIHCVTGWTRLNNIWEGPGSTTVTDLAIAKSEARYVIIHAAGNFTANLTLDDFLQPDVLFAIKCNDKELSTEHGYPVRLVVPRLYFWKSAKWVTGIEYSSTDKQGFWESAGYHNHGDPWLEERYQ